ncbi:MAG TPA: ATP-binding protein [Stellaceae bacterium]|nr:ATP-binding protein [Stellaceae bacterium]
MIKQPSLMIKQPSLLRRITVRLAIATIIAGIASYGWLYRKAMITATELRDQTLIAQAQNIAAHLVIGADGSVAVNLPAAFAESYGESDGDYHYAVRDARGDLVLTSGHLVGPLPPFHHNRDRVYDYRPGASESGHMFGAAVKSTISGRTFETQVEEVASRDKYLAAAVTDEFVTDGGWLNLPLLFALLAVSIMTVRTTLAPLSRLSRLASEIQPGNPDNRLPEAGVPQEIIPLVKAMNSALDRLDRGFLRQREFTANAAHQLRTPLAVLQANIDTLPDETVATRLQRDLDSMTRIVTQLLLAARLESATIDLDEQVDLRAVAVDAATGLGPLAVAAGKSIEVDEQDRPVVVRGNSWMLLNALNNLVENALAQTPCGAAVRLHVSDEPAIEVIDVGPGVPRDMREKIFERFWRGDRDKAGAGLGLSIVRRTMRLLGGSVSVGDASGGGAIFTLHFGERQQTVL